MVRIVVFGKGGVGKSTFAAHLSAWFSQQGQRVLHVGCDPKADSSLLLLESDRPPKTTVELLAENPTADPRDAINRGRLGIDCVEVGGPEPGIGCGGRGITWALDFLERGGLLSDTHDVILFDVLGDVVCGGFAAPLRKGLADLVVIVASPDEMSFFAAGNIAKAVSRYAENGVSLAGLVLNQRSATDPELDGHAFARSIGAPVLGELPYSAALAHARRHRRTLIETAPTDPFALAVASVAHSLSRQAGPGASTPLAHRTHGPAEAMQPGSFAPTRGAASPNPQAGPGASTPLAHRQAGPGASTPLAHRTHGPAEAMQPGSFAPTRGAASPSPARLAGPSTLARLDRLLGFDQPEFSRVKAGVAAAVLERTGELRLTLQYGKLPPQRLILLPPGRGGAYLSMPNLGIAYHGSDPSVALHKLARWVASRLKNVTFDTLADWILDSPDSFDSSSTEADGSPARTPEGRVWNLRAGQRALEQLSTLLVPPGTTLPHDATLARADSRTDQVMEIDLALPGGGLRSLLLVPLGAPSFLDVSTCGIGHAGEADEVTVDLVKAVAGPLAGHTLESLHDVVRSDPESVPMGKPGGPEHDDASFRQTPPWRQFFADDHFARNVHQLLQYEAPHVAIEHCDRECMYPTPPALEHQPDIVDYPWLAPPPYHGHPLARKGAGGITLTTDLRDADVVRGAIVRLERALDRVASGIEDEQFVLVHNTCTPVVAGEDVSGLVHRAGRRSSVPLMYTAPHIEGNPLADFFAQRKKERGFVPHPPTPGLVNLVGFPTNRSTDELCALLRSAGIEINDRPFPRVDLRVFDTYLKAAVQVFYPEHYLGKLRDALFADLPLTTLEPEAPYGFQRTRAWLSAVAGAVAGASHGPRTGPVGGAPDGECCAATNRVIAEGYDQSSLVIIEEEEHRLSEWRRLQEKASSCTLGFVVDAWRLDRLTDPAVSFGLPLLPVVVEMGFQVEILAFSGGSVPPYSLRERVLSIVPSERLTFGTFGGEEELGRCLSEGPAHAFYSDFSQDQRLMRAGKGRFSSQAFEMGYAGAIRTIERLAAICQLPFFRRYGRVGWP